MNEQIRNEIVHRCLRGQSQREIARKLHVSRNTIRTVLNDVQQARDGNTETLRPTSCESKRPSMLDPFQAVLNDLILRYPEIPAVQVQRKLQSIGCEASYTIVRQKVNSIRQRVMRGDLASETGPGAKGLVTCREVAIEFTSTGHRWINLFIFRLAYSGELYLHFTLRNDLASTIHEHVCAFDHFSGAAASIAYDNVPVSRVNCRNSPPMFHPTFLSFASHYGFRPVHCSPDLANEQELVMQVRTAVLQKACYRSLDHANDALITWSHREETIKHKARHNPNLSLQQHETAHLIPLPTNPWHG